jgi:phosphotriesterase-related protein
MSDEMPRAMCVTGDTASLGDVLLHEHLLFDLTSRLIPPSTAELISMRDEHIALSKLHDQRFHHCSLLVNLTSPSLSEVAAELLAFRAGRPAGSCTVVDTTCSGAGRNLAGLLSLSKDTGVNIIASAGVSADEAAAACVELDGSTNEDEAPSSPLTERLVSELTHGVDLPTQSVKVKCGALVVGEGILSGHARVREVTLQALGQAQLRTGAPIILPLPAYPSDGRWLLDAVRSLAEHGASVERVVIGHAQNLMRAAGGKVTLLELLKGGASLCFDGFGCGWAVAGSLVGSEQEHDPWLSPPSDEVVVAEVAALVAAGHGTQQLLSHAVTSRLQLSLYGGGGLTHIARFVRPRLTRAGLTAEATHRLCMSNAAQLLAWWLPAAPATRLCKIWECTGCHRSFEEAANPAEALPTDQNYYEKFNFRYCSTSCLSSHRKANFVVPFACPPP